MCFANFSLCNEKLVSKVYIDRSLAIIKIFNE